MIDYFFTYAEIGFPCLHGPFTSEPSAARAGHQWQEANEDDPRWHCVKLTSYEARIWLSAVDETAQAWIDDVYATNKGE